MNYDIFMPKLGTTSKYKLTRISVEAGQEIKVGDKLFEVEAGKASKAVYSEYQGVIKELLVEEFSEIEVGKPVLIIEGEEGQTKEKETVAAPKPQSTTSKGGIKGGYFDIKIKKAKKDMTCDIAILGGGPGGYVAAIKGAQEGKKVIVIEKDKLGGTCLNRGCIPTKALVRSVEVLENIKSSEKYGLGKFEGNYDLGKMIDRKNQVVEQLVSGIGNLMESNNITVLYGAGKFEDKNTLLVEGKDFDATVKAENIIIATGSRPAVLPIPGIDNPNVLNSTEILDMRKLPSSMVIVGGGVIGMEFAFILNSLGVQVTVVEMMPQILSIVDQEVAEELHNVAITKGIRIHTSAKLERIEKIENGGNLVIVEKGDQKINLVAEKIFISIGRALNTEDMGLEKIGVEMEKRAIKVDKYLQTNVEGIYAIGDVNGQYMLAHVASTEGFIAIDNILGKEKKMEYHAVPSAIFTHPEIACVGLTEKEAVDKGFEVKIGKFPYAANGKSLAAGEEAGFVKIIADEHGKILGGWIIGYSASDLIPQITLAINNGLTVEDVVNTIYAHPTISECIPEACHGVFGHPIHLP
ncbi:dihydrolipoyl dehydrogenase [Clostridiaceae bacterium 35-E11]